MTDESEYRPRLTALELAHEKLDGTLREQSRHSEHLDRKAARTLEASLAFSGVATAVVYYISRQGDSHVLGSLDNPFTVLALSFGLASMVLSVVTISHTRLETELTPGDVRRGALYGRKELLITLVRTYPEYIRRNDERLDTDKTLLSAAQLTLVFAVVCTVVAVASYVGNRFPDLHEFELVVFVVELVAGGIIAGLSVTRRG